MPKKKYFKQPPAIDLPPLLKTIYPSRATHAMKPKKANIFLRVVYET